VSDPTATTPGDADVNGEPEATPGLTFPSGPAPAPITAQSEVAAPFTVPAEQPWATGELPAVPASASPYPTQYQPTAPYPTYPAGAYYAGSAPVSATPYSALPYSAAPYSATPYAVVPYPAAQHAAKRNTMAIVFGSLALVLLLGVGAVTTLYVLDRGEAIKKGNDQQAQIVALEDRLDNTEDDLTDAKSELRRTEVDLAEVEKDLEKAAAGCPKAVQEFFDAVKQVALQGKANSPEATAATQRMIAACGVSV
jgi:hypothetical protein